ncbi:putative beta-lactamase [Arthrobacter sp. PAMC 25486]|uniref:serine hydrolase domain-containing protein n=1 Tax=Arthrobacter sp. PAMC 25486 TaxID=1494608 RepID=UPI0005359D20|nr:serine hydrolase domain-containing protein [Arthrobacter sp. PAMC 25486]AIY03458.1 putative beta-lactamase [Arthrobacter sp. PAMC 25486]
MSAPHVLSSGPFSPGASNSGPFADGGIRHELQRLLNQAVKEGVAPAVSCAVALQGVDHSVAELPVITAGACGSATLFDLASVTKLFTTVTALALVGDGRLELDAPVGRHLRAYARGDKSAVTLRHLLTHTSGAAVAVAGLGCRVVVRARF